MKRAILEILDNESLSNRTKEYMLFNYVKSNVKNPYCLMSEGAQVDQYLLIREVGALQATQDKKSIKVILNLGASRYYNIFETEFRENIEKVL
ncbi:MAG: hypothetical protein ACRDDE_10225 [Paraclostridium sp.]|uniref:hypothetical protein n=1 Tax=Paraclostridium sp. TaxID=2023273 RepID=UPI003EE4D77B